MSEQPDISEQNCVSRHQPVPRARLSPAVRGGLWVLRIAVVVLSAMVIYTFVVQIG